MLYVCRETRAQLRISIRGGIIERNIRLDKGCKRNGEDYKKEMWSREKGEGVIDWLPSLFVYLYQ